MSGDCVYEISVVSSSAAGYNELRGIRCPITLLKEIVLVPMAVTAQRPTAAMHQAACEAEKCGVRCVASGRVS